MDDWNYLWEKDITGGVSEAVLFGCRRAANRRSAEADLRVRS